MIFQRGIYIKSDLLGILCNAEDRPAIKRPRIEDENSFADWQTILSVLQQALRAESIGESVEHGQGKQESAL
jgi:hypothetical protein